MNGSVEFIHLENGHITKDGVFQFPNDPDLDYIAETSNEKEAIYLYPHNIIAFTFANNDNVEHETYFFAQNPRVYSFLNAVDYQAHQVTIRASLRNFLVYSVRDAENKVID